MRDFPHMQAEFPDAPLSELPEVPAPFDDAPCWRNDASPAFGAAALGLLLWIDRAAPELRQMGGPEECPPRFLLQRAPFDAEGVLCDTGEDVLCSENWPAILAAIIGEAFAANLRRDLTPDQFAEMRRRNAGPGYGPESGVCASHEFCDANMPMAEAFEAVMGRPVTLDDTPGQQEDFALWGAAWDYAKARHLTASPIDVLVAEYADWIEGEGLPEGDAMELLMGAELTADQRQWLSAFVVRWDAAEAADPRFYDRQTVVKPCAS